MTDLLDSLDSIRSHQGSLTSAATRIASAADDQTQLLKEISRRLLNQDDRLAEDQLQMLRALSRQLDEMTEACKSLDAAAAATLRLLRELHESAKSNASRTEFLLAAIASNTGSSPGRWLVIALLAVLLWRSW